MTKTLLSGLKGNEYTSREAALWKKNCLPSEKGKLLKETFRSDPFPEGSQCAGKQTGSNKNCHHCENGRTCAKCNQSP